MSDVFTAEGLNIEYAGDPTFVYGQSATASAQPFIGIIGHHTGPDNVNSMVNYGKTIDHQRGGAFGYHFYVGRDGRIVQGAPLTKRTNHVKAPNTSQRSGRPGNNLANNNAIGVSMVGGTPGNATQIQIATTVRLMQALLRHFSIPNTSVFGHGEVQSDRQAEEGMAAVRQVRGNDNIPEIQTGVQQGGVRNTNLSSSSAGIPSSIPSSEARAQQLGVSLGTAAPAGNLIPVDMNGVTIYVTPDYYMSGGIRQPVGLTQAWQIADSMGMTLPTAEMVDAIWRAAEIKLEPQPLPPGPEMTTTAYFVRHNNIIEDQLRAYGNTSGKLIAGHKKDIVASTVAEGGRDDTQVAIYGWHRISGSIIQPRSRVHGREYKDYSHGLRLVSLTATPSASSAALQGGDGTGVDGGGGGLAGSGVPGTGSPSAGVPARAAQTLTINTRDKSILDLIASKESNGQYDIVYPNTENPQILQMSLQEILAFQNEIGGSAMAIQYSRNTAIGRYQLIQDQVVQGISLAGLDREIIRFTPDVQDAMTLQILKEVCGYEDWLQGSLTTDQFQFNLAGQFESIPLPCAQQEGEEDGRRGGRIGSQIAQYDCDTFADQLNDIRSMPRGNDITLTVDPGSSGVNPAGGASERRQVESALGNGVHTGGHQGRTPGSGLGLPAANAPYVYQPIDPYDDRYDFRTGKKVRDLLINGINPVSAASLPPVTQGSNSTPGVQGGVTGTVDPQGTTTGTPTVAEQAAAEAEVGLDAFGGGTGYTAEDARNVEQLRSFNQQLGGGSANAQLTPGERAYAQQQGYLNTPTGSSGGRQLPTRPGQQRNSVPPTSSGSGPF